MNRHQLDGVLLFFLVEICEKRDFIQKFTECHVRILAGCGDGTLEFRNVIKSFLIALHAKVLLVAGQVHDLLQDVRKKIVIFVKWHLKAYHFALLRHPLTHGLNCVHVALCSRPSEFRIFERHLQGFIEGDVIFFGDICKIFQLLFADFARGEIDCPPESDVISLRKHPQVAHNILDFPAAVKGYAAVNCVGNLCFYESFLNSP